LQAFHKFRPCESPSESKKEFAWTIDTSKVNTLHRVK
jgi:hypothetical protein